VKKAIWVVGMFAIATETFVQVFSYFEGLAFDSWFFGPLVFVPLILGSICAFLYCSISLLISVLRKKNNLRALVPVIMFPALFAGTYYLPLPRFVDGLHDAVEEKLDRERLLHFAEAARQLKLEDYERLGGGRSVELLSDEFSLELSMGNYPARIFISEAKVNVYYGGALTGHWGYAIVEKDECPKDYLPSHLCRKVFDNVWVYKDIY
jgi:hypothetical protein